MLLLNTSYTTIWQGCSCFSGCYPGGCRRITAGIDEKNVQQGSPEVGVQNLLLKRGKQAVKEANS